MTSLGQALSELLDIKAMIINQNDRLEAIIDSYSFSELILIIIFISTSMITILYLFFSGFGLNSRKDSFIEVFLETVAKWDMFT